jgi:hypothetical protein
VKQEEPQTLLTVLWKIAFVSCCLWLSFFAAWWCHHRQQEIRKNDPRFVVKRIAARPLTQDRLPIGVLTELLHLDKDSPVSLFSIQPQEAQQKLLSCPAFARAKVWRLLPGTLGIEYALKTPVATIAGFKNIALDATGATFFLFPFYAHKKLPSIIIPIESLTTLADVQRRVRRLKETGIALRLLDLLSPIAKSHHLVVDVLDVSQFHQQSIFRREVVIVFSSILSKEDRLYVRVHSKKLLLRIELLNVLLDHLFRGAFRGGTIDLRYDGYAILSGEIAQKT